MPKIPVDNCCGCTACYNICPKQAIQMNADQEGFLYPIVEASLCVDCGLCEKVCPVMQPLQIGKQYTDCVVAQNMDADILDESTSGGFIDAVCKYVLDEKKGYAAGVIYDETFMPVHCTVSSYQEAKAFRNSKYAQSNLGETYKQVEALLHIQKNVLFIGTPCQVAGLKTFLRREYDNLLTIDLVCRSVPSPALWQQYLQWQKSRYKSEIVSIACRKKTYGYHSGTLEIQFSNKKIYRGSNRVDPYMKSFHCDICSRPSCYRCVFKTEHRCSDFTVFDSWKPQEVSMGAAVDDNRGYSNVIAHTQKAKQVLQEVKGVILHKADPQIMFQHTGGMESTSIQYPMARNNFYKDLMAIGFYKTVKKHISVTLLDKLIEKTKPIYYAIKNSENKVR